MNDILEKLKNALESVERKREQLFYIAILIKRNDFEDKWDLIMSAPWISEEDARGVFLTEVVEALKEESFPLDLIAAMKPMNLSNVVLQSIIASARDRILNGSDCPLDYENFRANDTIILAKFYIAVVDPGLIAPGDTATTQNGAAV